MSSSSKDNKIKTLEEIIVDLRHDPKDPKGVKALMKKKDDDIATLRKKIEVTSYCAPSNYRASARKRS